MLHNTGGSAQCYVITKMGGMRGWDEGSRKKGCMYTKS